MDVNIKSHGGYTPLHLACQFGHQEVFDLIVKAYHGDPLIRDNHGKTPRQYMMAQEMTNAAGLTLSSDTFRYNGAELSKIEGIPELFLLIVNRRK